MKPINILRAFKYIWPRAKVWVLLTVIFTLILGISPIISLWILRKLINTVSLLIQNHSSNFTLAFGLLLLLFVLTVSTVALQSLQGYMDNRVRIKLEHDLKREISMKTSSVPLSYYDVPEFYNHLNRIQNNPGNNFLAPIQNIVGIAQAMISGMSFLLFLLSIHWSLVLLSIVGAIPVFIVQTYYGNKQFWLHYFQSPIAREAGYIERLLNQRQTAQEIRLFNLQKYLLKRWSDRFMKNANESLSLLKKRSFAEVGLEGLTALFYAGAAGIIIWLIRKSTVKIGDFVAIGQAVEGTQSAINQISSNLAQMYEDCLYINDFFGFIDFKKPSLSKATANLPFPNPLIKGVIFSNISFQYERSEHMILKDIDLFISKGEKIALVGHNGSGKTTLIKCLLGLYTPTKGEIYIDDININKMKQEELRKHISVIFQDFIKYSFSVRENIGFGNVEDLYNINKVKEVAQKSGVDQFVNEFEDKYETYLGRNLRDGVDLSGGQWQKIALSRALFKNGDIIILDEPTASLDPASELEVFNQFKRMTKDKTAIFVSHRMSVARMADRIIVMKNGRVIEVGTHEELTKFNGEYSNMYNMQSQWYTEKESTRREVATWRS